MFGIAFAVVLLAAVGFRGAGLWHGLDQELIYHPDAPKQVLRLENYLRGHYVHHVGNLFFDGYPYGLNRVDEAFLRVWNRFSAAAASWSEGLGNVPALPSDHVSLYRQGRVLRLLYGVLSALLVFASARRWGAGRWASLAGSALYAAAPLAVTVAHSVTGDVGVDLFVALALYTASSQAVTGRAIWWLAFGAACGAGFACKFQGSLAAWMAVPPLLVGLRDGWRGWKRLAGAGLLTAAGFVGAAVLLNPALALDTTRAWRDTVRNFGFIQNYGVPGERLAWPFGRKVAWGLSHNVPFVGTCLGWGFVALSLAASGMLVAAAWRPAFGRRGGSASAIPSPVDSDSPPPSAAETLAAAEAASRCSRWLLGIATFPWLAFVLATALKLEIQPFHFTFLVPPMALAVALAVSWWTEPPDGEPRPLAAIVATLLVAAVLAEAVSGTSREMFFWRRPEIREMASRQSVALFGAPQWGTARRSGRWIKRFYAEPATLSCFRNRDSYLAFPTGAWSMGQTFLPVPAIPMPDSPDSVWMFLDGPVFPRSDRMFTVPATGSGNRPPACAADGSPLFLDTLSAHGVWTERILVFPAPPKHLSIGLRTGRLPARCEVSTSRWTPAPPHLLPPESQTILELPPPPAVYSFPADDEAGRPAVWACRLRVRAQIGPVWVSVLATPEEVSLFRMHGPADTDDGGRSASDDGNGPPPVPIHPLAADRPLFAREMARLRYLDSDTPWPIPVASLDSSDSSIPQAGPGLAAGAYRFRARIRCDAPATVSLALSDRTAADAPDTLPSASFSFDAGEHDLEWAFSKPFAPYGATLRAASDVPGTVLLSWTVKPDVETMAIPGWMPPPPSDPVLPGGADPLSIPATPITTVYPRIATLLDIRIPDSWYASGTVPYSISVRPDSRLSHKAFGELAFFLHLLDDSGALAGTLDFSFSDASFEGGPLRWKLNTPALPPGTYTLSIGLFNGRHGRKIPFAPHKRTIPVKTVTVLPD